MKWQSPQSFCASVIDFTARIINCLCSHISAYTIFYDLCSSKHAVSFNKFILGILGIFLCSDLNKYTRIHTNHVCSIILSYDWITAGIAIYNLSPESPVDQTNHQNPSQLYIFKIYHSHDNYSSTFSETQSCIRTRVCLSLVSFFVNLA